MLVFNIDDQMWETQPMADNIKKYVNNINERLTEYKSMVQSDADQNLLSRAVVAEDFCRVLLNTLMGWKLKNANLDEKNAPGIDLIDVENAKVVQVSLTCDRNKIQTSLNKFQKPKSASDWEFYFVPLKDDIPHFKKDFVIPEGITFNKTTNILTTSRIIELARTDIDKLKNVSDILDKLMGEQKDHDDICNYLSGVLENKRKFHPSFRLMDNDGIDEKLFTYSENKQQLIPSISTDSKKVAPIWDLIKEEHKEGFHHIVIEGDGGIGKSVSLLSVTDDSKLLSLIPAIYIHMYELCKDGECISLADYFKNNYSGFEEKISQLAAQPDREGRPTLMLLLDGLNEVEFKLQYDLIKNIVKWTECHRGTQLIVTSRPIPQLESIVENAVHIRLKPLGEDYVKKHFEAYGIDDNSPIWETLKLPLFFTLYAKAANLPNQILRGYPIAKREPVGPATIIWNYLQRELLRMKEDSWVLKCALACEYISPDIAYKMALLNRFELSFEEANYLVDEAVSTININRLPEHLSQIKDRYARNRQQFPPKDFDWQAFVLAETGVFVTPKRGTNDHYSFMHQNFRDCLAGLHLVNVAQMALPAEKGGELPSEWKSSIPPLVLDYAAELMDADTAEKLWELNRTKCHEGIKIDNTSTYMQLELHRRLNTKSYTLNFSGMDLRGMSLTNYMGGEHNLGLFTSPELVRGTFLDRKVFESDGHRYPICCILSLNNGYFASGSYDTTIRIWNPNTGECIKTFQGHSGPVNCLALLPDGRLISGSDDNTIRIWDPNTGECIKTLKGHCGHVVCLTLLPDGKLISGSNDQTIRIWDIKTDECTTTTNNDKFSFVTCLALLHDSRIIAVSKDNTIRTWNIKTNEWKLISKSITCFTTLQNGNIVISSNDNTIRILDSNTGKCIQTFEGHSRPVKSLAVLANGHIISASDDMTIRIWDAETGECTRTIKRHFELVTCLAALPDNCIACGFTYIIRILNTETGEFIKTIWKHSNYVNSLAILTNGNIISSSNYMGTKNNIIRVWDIEDEKTYKCIKTFEGHSGPVRCLSVLPTGHIVSSSDDRTIQIWNTKTGECIKTFEKLFSLVNCLAVFPDGRIVSGSDDRIIRIWDSETGKCIQTFEDHSEIICLAILSGNRIISGSLDNTIKIWDTNTGECIKTLEGHSNLIRCLAVLPDGHIVSSSFDNTIRIWNSEKGKCIQTIKEHSYYANSLAVFTDGRIVTAWSDSTIRILDSNTGTCIKTIEWLSGFVKCLVLLHDKLIIGASVADSTIQIWDPDTGKCLNILEPTEVDVSKMDFSKAIMDENTAKLLYQNGAIIPTSFIEED